MSQEEKDAYWKEVARRVKISEAKRVAKKAAEESADESVAESAEE